MVNEVVELLSKLVSIKTVNNPDTGEKPLREAAEFIQEWLGKHGVDSEIIEYEGYYSVYGVTGEDPNVMFLAHYDTVPVVRERWSYDPFKLTIVGDKAYGRGALDDKSNVAAIMLALTKLREKDIPVVFAFTGDEEIGGYRGARVIAEKIVKEGITPHYLINGDGMGMVIIIRRRKAFKIEIAIESSEKKIRGKIRRVKYNAYYPVTQKAHAAYFTPGVDSHPLLAISAFIRENRVYLKEVKGVFIKSNVIPPEAEIVYVEPDPNGEEVSVDVSLTELFKNLLPLSRVVVKTRAFSEYGVSITPNIYRFEDHVHKVILDVRAMSIRGDIEDAFNNAVKELLPQAKLKIVTGPGKYLYTPREAKLVKVFSEVLSNYGYEPILGEGAGASDSRYFTNIIKEIIDFGPRGGGMHGDNEYVVINDLRILPKIYVDAALRISG